MNKPPHSALHDWHLENARILVRADLNIIHNDTIPLDAYRFQQLLPTLELIRKKGGNITLISHIGRPNGYDQHYSTRRLLPLFENINLPVIFASNPQEVTHLQSTNQHGIILMENLRFFAGEQRGDMAFAQQLATMGDYFVDDAFGSLHREDCSITILPRFFKRDHRTYGLLVEHELSMLKRLLIRPKRPFLIIIGGAKISDKIPMLVNLLHKVNQMMLLPAIVFTFLKAQGKSIGLSLHDDTLIPLCASFLQDAAQLHKQLLFPLDYQQAQGTTTGQLSFVDATAIAPNGIGISIGPKTIARWKPIIENAGTIFFNGFPGLESRMETIIGAQELLTAIAHSHAFTVVGGGDTVQLVQQLHLEKNIDLCSTGGGATIAFLSDKPLPGLIALETP